MYSILNHIFNCSIMSKSFNLSAYMIWSCNRLICSDLRESIVYCSCLHRICWRKSLFKNKKMLFKKFLINSKVRIVLYRKKLLETVKLKSKYWCCEFWTFKFTDYNTHQFSACIVIFFFICSLSVYTLRLWHYSH